jgi:hypothetical protein
MIFYFLPFNNPLFVARSKQVVLYNDDEFMIFNIRHFCKNPEWLHLLLKFTKSAGIDFVFEYSLNAVKAKE